jgi:hypothetical protein
MTKLLKKIFLQRLLFTVLLAFLCFYAGYSQQKPLQEDTWKILFEVKYGDWLAYFNPKFTDKIKALHQKTITIKGYLIPLQEQKKHTNFLLSAFPYDMCFYCGKAGPETVIEVTAKKPIKTTNEMITLRGTLQLNSQDPNHLFYIMPDAELLEK